MPRARAPSPEKPGGAPERLTVAGREIRIERQTMGEDPGPVTVTGPSGAERSIAVRDEKPGLYAAQMQSRELGLHSVRSGDLVAFVSVGPANPRELADVFSDTERLRPIAEATGGSFTWDGEDDRTGRLVASGVYLVSAVGSDGATVTGKVAVIR